MAPKRNPRSSSRHLVSPLSRSNSHNNVATEVIVLSEEEGSSGPRKKLRTTMRKPAQLAPRKAVAIPQDVIEISSDEEESPPDPTSNPLAALQQQLKAVQEENSRLRRRLEKRAELPRTPPEVLAQLESNQKLLATLEDDVSCEICTLKMWSPASLACGHTFCQSCLQDWFDTILTKHKAEDPNYEPIPRGLQHYYDVLRTSGALSAHDRNYIQQHIRTVLATVKHPTYTCPTCRSSIAQKPFEVLALKQFVRRTAEAKGEASPKKKLPPRGSREVGPWERFFPIPPVSLS